MKVEQSKTFTICLKGVNENKYMSNSVVLKLGKRMNECNNNDGLPCMNGLDTIAKRRRSLIEYDNENELNRFNRMYWIGVFMCFVFLFSMFVMGILRILFKPRNAKNERTGQKRNGSRRIWTCQQSGIYPCFLCGHS